MKSHDRVPYHHYQKNQTLEGENGPQNDKKNHTPKPTVKKTPVTATILDR